MESSFSFDIQRARIQEAIWFESYFHTSALRKIRKILQWVFWIAFFLFLLTFIPENAVVSERTLQFLLAVVFLTFSYTAATFILEYFGQSLRKIKPAPTEPNLAEFLSFDAARAATHAYKFARHKKHPHVDSSLLLYFLLKDDKSLKFIFDRSLLDEKAFLKLLRESFHSDDRKSEDASIDYAADFQEAIRQAIEIAKGHGRIVAEAEDLFASLAIHNTTFKDFLVEHNFFPEKDIANIAEWHYLMRHAARERKKFWSKKNLRKYTPIGKDWASGYSLVLDRFSYDLSKSVASLNFPKAVAHQDEKQAIERILSRQRINNVLLIGNPGSGRKRIIQDLASKSVLGEYTSDFLNYKRVIELDLPHLLSSAASLEEAEAMLGQVFQEAKKSGNIILVIEDFHNFIEQNLASRTPGRINIAGILSPFLRAQQLPLIAVTTFAGFHRYIEQNPSLLAQFENVTVTELTPDESFIVLQEIVPAFEKLYRSFISYPALKSIIALADKYIQATPFPKKAIDLLDESMGYLAQTSDTLLLPEHISAVVTERTHIPVGEIESSERETLLDLENLIHRRIINQEEAVKEVASALRRARTEVSTRKGPMGSFLFMGPTGVGKTETAKALAAIYFGSESRMIRLDMSEFQKVEDVDRLLGSPIQEGLLTTPIREAPFSLLLLDELEKAHPNILNLFLQVLDEGNITDGLGRKTDFRHTIIIATSNAGYQLILKAIKENVDFPHLKQQMLDYLFEKGIYRPEFINRFDGVVIFSPLSKEHLFQIANLMLGKLQNNLREKGIEFVVTDNLKQKIAELGYNPTFGARNMRRVLQDKVENALAIALLSNKIKRGQRITVDANTFEVKKL